MLALGHPERFEVFRSYLEVRSDATSRPGAIRCPASAKGPQYSRPVSRAPIGSSLRSRSHTVFLLPRRIAGVRIRGTSRRTLEHVAARETNGPQRIVCTAALKCRDDCLPPQPPTGSSGFQLHSATTLGVAEEAGIFFRGKSLTPAKGQSRYASDGFLTH